VPGFCYSARLRDSRYVVIAMSPPPPGASQKPGDYEKGDKVWAEDGGELLCGIVDIMSSNTECKTQGLGGGELSKAQPLPAVSTGT